ncbi:cytochrome b/b6 domain-containing protein [Uliginosibacterium flavum]|uniref:Cytochrome b/b6 domain-containing protein n=1 Tax=Uliginosibacterium flavum TaxID=1396831 RepID=A0ABV2TKM8_9RHOO
MTETKKTRRIKLWDLPLRLFHWALLICVAGAIASIEIGENVEVHQYFGYAILSLLIFRVIWGVVGGSHARFVSFIRGPGTVLDYLKRMKEHKGPSIGHNPLGALSVLGMLAALFVQATSGLFLTDEIMFEAPLFKYISGATASLLAEIHEINAAIIFTLIGLHLAAILFYRFIKRENLITPMVTGNKEVPAELPDQDASGGSAWLGLLVFGVAAGTVWFIINKL